MWMHCGGCRFFVVCWIIAFFFKQKTAYEMRISDWSSDVCSSDLEGTPQACVTETSPECNNTVSGLCLCRHAADDGDGDGSHDKREQIGRASCRERVCQYV